MGLCAAGGVEEEGDEGFAVVDFAVGDHLHGAGEGHAEDFEVFVGFEGGWAGADVLGEVDLHPLAEEAGAGEVFDEHGPFFCAVSGLFDELAFGGGEGSFVGVAGAGGEFVEVLAGGVAVLALEDDVGVGGVLAFVDGEHDDGAVVADDVAGVFVAAGLDEGVGVDLEDAPVEGEFGGEELGAGGGPGGFAGGFFGGRFFSGRFFGWGGHGF